MMWDNQDKVLECQSCGSVVRTLTAAEAQQVAYSPYDYIVYCNQHRDDWKCEARKDGLL